MRTIFVWLLVPVLFGGCRGSSDPNGLEDDNPGLSDSPPGTIREIDPAANSGARRLAPGLALGDRILRDARISLDLVRIGPTEDLPAGEVLESQLLRTRLFRDEILAVGAGRPTSVRRTYIRSFEKASIEATGGQVQRREGAQPIEGARVRLTQTERGLAVEEEELPPGVTERDLEEVLVLDTVGLASFVPARDADLGESWSVPIDAIGEILGKKPPGAHHEGRILATFVRRVLYDEIECAHIGLVIDLTQTDEQSREVPFSKETRMLLEGEMYFAFGEGRPLYLAASGPTTIRYIPRGDAPTQALAKTFTLQGEMEIAIAYLRAP